MGVGLRVINQRRCSHSGLFISITPDKASVSPLIPSAFSAFLIQNCLFHQIVSDSLAQAVRQTWMAMSIAYSSLETLGAVNGTCSNSLSFNQRSEQICSCQAAKLYQPTFLGHRRSDRRYQPFLHPDVQHRLESAVAHQNCFCRVRWH